MAKYAWLAGSTSKTILLFIQDSASTTGAGRASVSAGNIVASEIRVLTNNTVARTTVSVTNLAALTDAYLSGGIFPVEPVTCPGWYRFDIPDSALSVGAVTAAISILGSLSASNIAQLALEIQLQNTPADMVAKAGVSVSVSTLFPSVVRMWDATSVSSSNLAVTDFSTRINANVQQWGGVSVSTNSIIFRSEISLSVVNVTAWAGISTSSNDIAIKDTLVAGTDITGTFNVNAVQWDGSSTSAQDVALFDSSALFNALVGLAVNTTRWAGASTSSNSIVFRSEISLSSVNVTAWAGTSVSASNLAIKNSVAASVSAVVHGQAMTEAYAADGAAFTMPQALYQIWARLSEFSISAQVITAFKLDGVTPAMTFSLDSATAPTKVERVT